MIDTSKLKVFGRKIPGEINQEEEDHDLIEERGRRSCVNY
jgi:hypothetical protein